jgi:hypothetical protein
MFSETKDNQEKPLRTPPRPRPGKKTFLDSILTMLSKTTTGTQYPDTTNTPQAVRTYRTKSIKTKPEKPKDNTKRTKYRSRVLNKNVENKAKDQKIIVLQSQKDITQTSSMFSENSSINASNSLVVKKPNVIADENKLDDVTNLLVKEIMEGKQYKKEKRVRIDEPVTMLSETKSPSGSNNGLYNFFVDLLETTISVYNVKAEYEKAEDRSKVASSTKLPLEIDESVALKLNVQQDPENHEDTCCRVPKRFYCFREDEELIGENQYSPAPTVTDAKTPKMKAKSFSFINKPKTNKMKTGSVIIENKKSYNRKQKKQTLLNLFKEQLKLDEGYMEPQNLYQALKVIAQNKKRCQKTIHFEENMRRNRKDYGFPECEFRRRKIISPGKKANRPTRKRTHNAIVTDKQKNHDT